MADIFYTNLNPLDEVGGTTQPWWATWKLTRAMVGAGYQIKACGDGSTYVVAGEGLVSDPIVPDSGDDLWSSFPTGSGAWLCLRNPSLGFDILFWRGTTSTYLGKIIIGKQGLLFTDSGGFTARGAGSSTPGTIPTGAGYLRGDGSQFIDWLGAGNYNINRVQIGVRDATGSEAGAFFLLGSTPSYSANTWGHQLLFTKLEPYATEQGTDPEPYIFFGPNSAVSGYGNYAFAGQAFSSDSAAGNQGYWWGFRASGNWSQFGGGYTFTGSTGVQTDPYSAGTKYFLDRFIIYKEETGYKERKGITKSLRYTAGTVAQYDTIKNFLWAKFSNGYSDGVMFWSGDPPGTIPQG